MVKYLKYQKSLLFPFAEKIGNLNILAQFYILQNIYKVRQNCKIFARLFFFGFMPGCGLPACVLLLKHGNILALQIFHLYFYSIEENKSNSGLLSGLFSGALASG